jgi:endonuclease V-like protein UPF0215 family
MAPRPYPEVIMRLGNAQLVEKNLRHVGVIVLAGMEYSFFNLIGKDVLNGTTNGRGFNYLRAGPDDGE